ncbi:hypothetical protein [Glutamicibacter sp.]|uniref:hypothetical protein n=1 Tax=Glutamicibacter sp. TaxID=1931995 RepID=UPI0028BE37F5|nr:hypothetical protein [Glutamicibacter sp.]
MSSPENLIPVRSATRTGVTIGILCVITGGLISAVTGPLDLDKGSWAAAYLVLVAGVVQYVVSMQEQLLNAPPRGSSILWLRTLLWAVGNTLVIAGALLEFQWLIIVGGAVLVFVLLMCLAHSRGAKRTALAWCARVVYLVVILSVPIGVFLAQR